MMFAEERLDRILSILQSDGKVKVKDLSNLFNVTEDCIRKDLKLLEKKGLLKRTYGGAVQVRVSPTDFEVMSRRQVNVQGKRIIAQKALNLIKDGETIFLDISTTNIILANMLVENNKRVTVVSNMLEVIKTLACPGNTTLIAAGGMFNNTYDGFVGMSTIEILSNYKFDRSFMGVVGLDVFENCISCYYTNDGYTKSTGLKLSKKSYLLVEERKFHADGNYKFAQIDDLDAIIFDTLPSEEILHALEDYEVELI